MTYDGRVPFIRLQEKTKQINLKEIFFVSMTTNFEKIFIYNLGQFFFLLQNCCLHTQLKIFYKLLHIL